MTRRACAPLPALRAAGGGRWVAVLVGALWSLVGCDRSAPPGAPTATVPVVDAATAGAIEVEVMLSGPVPTPRAGSRPRDPLGDPALIPPDPSLVIADGRIANAVVYLEEGLGDRAFAAPGAPAIIEQRDFEFVPHVSAVMVAQPVEFRNSDPEVHALRGSAKVARTTAVAGGGNGVQVVAFDAPEIGIPLRCDRHDWMLGYVSVFHHPYFGVTAPDGLAVLRHVPPGHYVVGVWHERLGSLRQTVTLEPKGAAKIRFTFGTE